MHVGNNGPSVVMHTRNHLRWGQRGPAYLCRFAHGFGQFLCGLRQQSGGNVGSGHVGVHHEHRHDYGLSALFSNCRLSDQWSHTTTIRLKPLLFLFCSARSNVTKGSQRPHASTFFPSFFLWCKWVWLMFELKFAFLLFMLYTFHCFFFCFALLFFIIPQFMLCEQRPKQHELKQLWVRTEYV